MTLAERLIRMFSFVGDTVLDPFLGTGTASAAAAAACGRNSVGCEIDPDYYEMAMRRVRGVAPGHQADGARPHGRHHDR